jgi:hypothetical protein
VLVVVGWYFLGGVGDVLCCLGGCCGVVFCLGLCLGWCFVVVCVRVFLFFYFVGVVGG